MALLRSLVIGFLTAPAIAAATSSCCDQLRARTSNGQVLDPLSPGYPAENSAYWSSTCKLAPKCIFTPNSASDVSTTVKVLTAGNCEFAIRGGGHTANPGWAGTSNGVLISLSHLKTIRFSTDSTSVFVGAGNRWGDVYTETGKRGVTVAGGRISPVGVSGFLLGGGLSYLMHQKGFAANSVLSYEIVLANGTIVNPSSTLYPDLFKALKGGTGNFGIVTQFQLQTYPINNVYAGNLYYAPAQFDKLFPAVEAYARNGAESDPKSHIISAWVNTPAKLLNMATFYAFYSDPVTSPPPGLKPFFDIPTTENTVKAKTVKEAVDELTVGTVNGLRYEIRDYSIRADAALFKDLFNLFQSTTTPLNTTAGFFSAIAFQPISNSMIRASEARGGNVLGLQPATDPLIVVNYQFSWASPSDDAKVHKTADQLMQKSMDLARARGKLADYIYLNYASTGQGVIEAYGADQVSFLRSVKAKYDPTGVFRNLVKGGFRVPT
ncbi:hypothetical protein FRC07_004281 [Ceratobasidium sp. 392]|nr:hypothetical protein FRC07_004281 [Ceratobasidium sp. 392]